MNDQQRIELDAIVCRGLAKHPGETLVQAALRAIEQDEPGSRRRRAAEALLGGSNRPAMTVPESRDVWQRMSAAAVILQDPT